MDAICLDEQPMQDDIATTVDHFLAVFHTDSNSDSGIARLIETLDQLAWLAHGVKYELDGGCPLSFSTGLLFPLGTPLAIATNGPSRLVLVSQ